MKKILSLSALIMVLLVITLLLSASLAYAQNSRIYLEPVDAPAGTLALDVVAENVTELYGAEFKLKFDPAVFSPQDLDPEKDGIQVETGSFLPANQGFVVVNQADEVEGIVTYALTLLNPAPPVSGTGPLARVTFDVLQPEASSTIEIENAKLVSFSLQTIPSELTPFYIGDVPPQPSAVDPSIESQGESAAMIDAQTAAEAQPEAQVAADVEATAPDTAAQTVATTELENEFPWWIIALGIILLGFLSLGIFAVVSGANKPQPTAKATRQSSPEIRMPTSSVSTNQAQSSEHMPGTRPSAFK